MRHFQGNDYLWVNARVDSYDSSNDKFIVKLEENKQVKSVNRLAIKFKWEDDGDFKKRIDQASSLYTE